MDEIPFEFTFFKENRQLFEILDMLYHLLMKIIMKLPDMIGDDPQMPGIVATEGIDVKNFYVPSQGQMRIDILVGNWIGYDETYAGIGSAIIELGPWGSKTTVTPEVQQLQQFQDGSRIMQSGGQMDK